MRSKSIKGNSTVKIEATLKDEMEDGYEPIFPSAPRKKELIFYICKFNLNGM